MQSDLTRGTNAGLPAISFGSHSGAASAPYRWGLEAAE